jgi:hypothetical protein
MGLVFVALLIKFSSPFIIQFLYQHHNTALLNVLSGASVSSSSLPIDFYLGRIEEVSVGPFSMVLSSIAFLLFSLKYLKGANTRTFGVVVFLYFLITKFEILFFPPFGDDMTGPFAEAIWLYQNAFDYLRLAQQPTFIHGGAKVYLFSIYPSFLALSMKIMASTKAFLFFNHFVALGLAAGVVTLFRSFLLKFFNQKLSLLLAILLMSFPVFQAQAESINMDMPALFFSLGSIYALSQKKFLQSGLLALVSIAIKFYSIFIGFAVFTMCVLIFFTQRENKKRFHILLSGSIPVAFGILQALFLFLFFNGDDNSYAVGLFSGRVWLVKSLALYLYGFSFLSFLIFFKKKIFGSSKKNFVFVVRKYNGVIVCFLASLGWFLIFGQSYFFGVRYYLHILPFFILCITFSTLILFKSRKVVSGLVMISIILANACSYGMNYKEHDYGQGSVRSLEYRSGVRFYLKLVDHIESRFSHATLVAPLLVAQALGVEKLGYAKKKMDVKIYFWPSKDSGIQELKEADELQRDRMIWIELDKKEGASLVDPVLDRVIDQVSYGTQEAKIFMGGTRIFFMLKMAQPFINAFERKETK